MKLRRTHLTAFILILLSNISFAQVVPPYNVSFNSGSLNGYIFLCPVKIGFNPGGINPTHLILDGQGDIVYVKNFQNGSNTGDFKLHGNGLMSYSRMGKFYLMDSTFNVVDSVACANGVNTDSHDMQILPNGNFLMLGIENLVMDLSSYSLFGPNSVPGDINAIVESGVIQELDVNKNLVFEWHAITNFAFSEVDVAWLTDPYVVDWTHCNAVEQDLDGNYLLSSRHFNEITKIDRQTGTIIWRLGGNANQFNFLNDPGQFKRQHDIRRLSNGNITLFDNGNGVLSTPFHSASGKEYQLDEINKTANLVWSYTDNPNEFSPAMGNFLRVPGGNSLLSYGITSSQNKVLNMVDNSGWKIFELAFDDTLRTYRAFYYDSLPWNINRPQITCYENSGQYYLDAGPGFSAYSWSDGSTTQVIPLTAVGNYEVYVPAGQGGFLRSETFKVYNMSDPCGLSGIAEHVQQLMQVQPNLADEFIDISVTSKSNSKFQVEIYNMTGELVYSINPGDKGKISVHVREFPKGLYVVRYDSAVGKFVKF